MLLFLDLTEAQNPQPRFSAPEPAPPGPHTPVFAPPLPPAPGPWRCWCSNLSDFPPPAPAHPPHLQSITCCQTNLSTPFRPLMKSGSNTLNFQFQHSPRPSRLTLSPRPAVSGPELDSRSRPRSAGPRPQLLLSPGGHWGRGPCAGPGLLRQRFPARSLGGGVPSLSTLLLSSFSPRRVRAGYTSWSRLHRPARPGAPHRPLRALLR